jgi:hypothetical protein
MVLYENWAKTFRGEAKEIIQAHTIEDVQSAIQSALKTGVPIKVRINLFSNFFIPKLANLSFSLWGPDTALVTLGSAVGLCLTFAG